MKIKFKELWEKTKQETVKIAKKLNKKAVVAVGAVVILGGAVLLNFLLVPAPEKKESGNNLDVAIDLSDVSSAIAEKEKENGQSTSKNDAFAEMTLSREQARDEAMEVLKEVAQSSTAIDSMKQDALNSIKQIAVDIENEANIEGLIKAKGFEECVAVVNGDTASVIVKTDGLLDNEVAQISEIVYNQTGIHPDNLRIIESE
ncbi:MAG: SpoIIIAH-like family protein [Ruminococcaceae bacterium]|nr:SpoIIIAH-like family protein [Oscillospiraceae bacterium]